MGFPPEFTPLELRGMSVITAIFFFFIGIGVWTWWSTIKREFKRLNLKVANNEVILNTNETSIVILKEDINRIDNKLEHHDIKLEERNKDISEMKIDIALTLQAVKNIEKMLERYNKNSI